MKEVWNEQKKQVSNLNHLNTELETAGKNALKKENESWQKILDEIKYTHQKEIQRKQEETNKLHDLLAAWIFRYMELQEAKGVIPTHPEKMLYETFKRKEIPQKALLEKALSVSRSTTTLNRSPSTGGGFGLGGGSTAGALTTPRKRASDVKPLELGSYGLPVVSHKYSMSSTARSHKKI